MNIHARHPDQTPPPEPFWKRFSRIAFLLAAGIAAVLLLAKEWDAIAASLIKANPVLVAFALIAAMINVVLTGISWRALLARAPVRLDVRTSSRIFFIGQIGKYLPGTVWSFLASGELAQQAGLPRLAAISSLGLALIIGVGIGGVLALVTVPQALGSLPVGMLAWLIVAGLFLLGLTPRVRAFLLRLARIDFPVPLLSFGLSGATAFLAWVFAGIQVLLLAQAVGAEIGWSEIPSITGAYAFAWIAGFLVFFAPAGLGAREGSLLAMLHLTMGLAEASAVVLLSRLAVTFADFACAGLATLVSRPQAAQATA